MNDVYLFCYMDGSQENLIYHFIRYYSSLGIPIQNWKILLHGSGSKHLLDENKISYEIVSEYHSQLKANEANKFIQSISKGWLVYPDLDEFFDYGNSLKDTIEECDKSGIELVIGKFEERFAPKFELRPIIKEHSIHETFPTTGSDDILKVIFEHQNLFKIVLVKVTEKKKPIYLNSHKLVNQDMFKTGNKISIVNHFRWSTYTKDCMRRKLSVYIKSGEEDKITYYVAMYGMTRGNFVCP